MSAVWGVAVILERFFENTHIVHPQNIGENGRIVIDKGRKEIFFLFLLHYNDTCKVNPSFTGGECKVVKLNILNMKNFLDTVNSCSGKVNMLWGRKDTGQFVAAILPKQKLFAACFRSSESNGLYEHCFVLCRGLLIYL